MTNWQPTKFDDIRPGETYRLINGYVKKESGSITEGETVYEVDLDTRRPGPTYEPGFVGIATVRGLKDVQVMRVATGGWASQEWRSSSWVQGLLAHQDEHVTDVRPLPVYEELERLRETRAEAHVREVARLRHCIELTELALSQRGERLKEVGRDLGLANQQVKDLEAEIQAHRSELERRGEELEIRVGLIGAVQAERDEARAELDHHMKSHSDTASAWLRTMRERDSARSIAVALEQQLAAVRELANNKQNHTIVKERRRGFEVERYNDPLVRVADLLEVLDGGS